MRQERLVCIRCPLGCALTAQVADGAVSEVRGNGCPRGAAYAQSELVDPRRTVTGTVRVAGGLGPVVSVKTVPEVPKGAVLPVARALAAVEVTAPVALGQCLVEGLCGTGSALVATAAMAARPQR